MKFLKLALVALFSLSIIGITAFLTFGPGIVEKGRNAVAEHSPYPVSSEAQKLHEELTIGDWHADSLLWKRNLLKRGNRGHVDIPRLQDGNVGLQMFTAVTKSPAGQNYDHNSANATDNITLLAIGQLWPRRTWTSIFERAVYQADRLHRYQNEAPRALKIIKTKADLEMVLERRKSGKKIIGALLGIEGAHPLEGKIENLQKLQDAGFRMVALQHFFDNALGGSLHGTGNHGLTDFGRQVVQAVEQRNLILDVSHSSPQVAWDVLEITRSPIVVSHTGIHGNCPVKRNFPDNLMQAIAKTGGVIAIGFWADVTCDHSPKGIATAIRAAIDLVGEDHVSLGSDFDGSVTTGFDVSELPALTHALLENGLTPAQIHKVMGQNMIRVLRARLK